MRRVKSPVFAVAVAAVALSSCGGAADLAFRADRSATVSLSIEVPAAVEAKLRQFASSGGVKSPERPMFDASSVSASVAARGAVVKESASPSARSYRGSFAIADMERLLRSDEDLAGLMEYARGPSWASIRIRASRDNAASLAKLFPGLDAELLEALQPPALYDNPVSAAEYRSMLAGLLGKAAIAAVDGLSLTLSASFPGPVLDSSGSVKVDASKRSATLSIPALSAMVLEAPVEFYVKWKE